MKRAPLQHVFCGTCGKAGGTSPLKLCVRKENGLKFDRFRPDPFGAKNFGHTELMCIDLKQKQMPGACGLGDLGRVPRSMAGPCLDPPDPGRSCSGTMELAFAASRPVAQLSGGVKGVSQPWQRVKTHRTQALGEAERLEMPDMICDTQSYQNFGASLVA